MVNARSTSGASAVAHGCDRSRRAAGKYAGRKLCGSCPAPKPAERPTDAGRGSWHSEIPWARNGIPWRRGQRHDRVRRILRKKSSDMSPGGSLSRFQTSQGCGSCEKTRHPPPRTESSRIDQEGAAPCVSAPDPIRDLDGSPRFHESLRWRRGGDRLPVERGRSTLQPRLSFVAARHADRCER